MKFFLLAPVLALTACTATGKCDSGAECDSGTTSATPYIQYFEGVCDGDTVGSTCTWTVEADGEVGLVEIDLIETGDPSFDCSQTTEGQLICGVWTEYHNAFDLVTSGNSYGGDTKAIDLTLKGSFTDQVNNSSTIFKESIITSTLTAMVTISDASGNPVDCLVGGHDPSYFADSCANGTR